MREVVLDLMGILAQGAEADNKCADQLAAIAAFAASAGDHLCASGMLAFTHNHRIRALELRGNLTATMAQWGSILHQNLSQD